MIHSSPQSILPRRSYGGIFPILGVLLLITGIFFLVSFLAFVSFTSQLHHQPTTKNNAKRYLNQHSGIQDTQTYSNNDIQKEIHHNNFRNEETFFSSNDDEYEEYDHNVKDKKYEIDKSENIEFSINEEEHDNKVFETKEESRSTFDAELKNLDTVTLLTQTSLEINRVQRVVDLMSRWPGELIIVAVLPNNHPEYARSRLSSLRSYIKKNDRTDTVKIVPVETDLSNKALYPINKLRNLAISHVKSKYYLLLDVDFLPSDTLYENLHSKYHEELKKTQNKTVLVIPAFDLKRRHLANSIRTKIDAKKQYPKYLKQFHYKFPAAHEPTNYPLWMKTDKVYEIEYKDHYEPYFICHVDQCPLYREEFLGFGYNKLSQVYEAWTKKFRFRVLPEDFIMHVPHAYSKDVRSNAYLKNNMQLFIEMQQRLMEETGRLWLLFDEKPITNERDVNSVDWSIDGIQKRYSSFVSRRSKRKRELIRARKKVIAQNKINRN